MYPYYVTNIFNSVNKKQVVELTDGYDQSFWENITDEQIMCEEVVLKDGTVNIIDSDIIGEVCAEKYEIPINNKQANLEKVFKECTKCKEVKSLIEFSNTIKDLEDVVPSWCKSCKIKSHEKWLSENPNAKKANDIRKWLSDILNNKNVTGVKSLENITGLPLNKLKEWMYFTKQFYIPKGYRGQIDIEHEYPLSKYNLLNEENIKFCLNWKHLRYMTHEENLKKLNKDPSPKDKLKQMMIAYLWNVKINNT